MKSYEIEAALAKYAAIKPGYPHWLTGGKADSGLSFCRECAEKALKKLNDPDAMLDGGWIQEEDGTCCCEECGALLEHTLTEHGVQSEIDHFKRRRFSKNISAETAYSIAILIGSAPENKDAVRIALRALTASRTLRPVGDEVGT